MNAQSSSPLPGESPRPILQRNIETGTRLTGWQAVMDPEEMAKCGVDRVMVKPVKKTGLHRNVAEMPAGSG